MGQRPNKPRRDTIDLALAAAAKRRRVVRGVAAGIVIVILVAVALGRRSGSRRDARTYRVVRSSVEQTLTEVGRVEAKKVTMVHSPVSGEITWMIEEGTEVQAGDVIVKFDRQDILDQIDDREQRIVPVRNELNKAELDLQVAKEKTRLQIELAKLALKEADLKLAELEAKPLPDEKAQAALELKVAELEAERSAKEYATATTLHEKGLQSELVLKQKRLSALNAEAKREQARIVCSLKSQGAEKLALELARAGVEKAKLALSETGFNARSDVVTAEKELAVRQVRLSNSERSLKRRKDQLADCDVKAPVLGRVVFVNVWKGSDELSPIRVGESRRHGWDLLKIADTSALMVKLLVNEVDLGRIRLGAEARVRLVAYPEDVFEGKVAHVGMVAADKNDKLGPLALARSGEAGVKVVDVTVELAERDPRIRLGFGAEVEIVTDVVEDAIAVPRAALGRSAEGPYCMIWTGSSPRRVPVELGETSAAMVRVVSGLKEGDQVVADLAAYFVE